MSGALSGGTSLKQVEKLRTGAGIALERAEHGAGHS